ncbi:L,D-transpeptidase family protein [Photobacterium sp. DNB23_23_1]|uniref:L,D-transpeptidase family protein n=1 Tax=Photobacterium pectinilyticum TaxID=2906793 RepID=A0ABT1MXR2_9GAMM|nr:L,D-transpeptidase family protein [Photobacterium sp. ZSDE20]MCQ1057278.1 L,D-transpeptidase family protein [Photobacterium sp. ZSDE20]MDD1821737.1 L,D-transpeptidase family protein [Photobacterium sp. ZSDE20]
MLTLSRVGLVLMCVFSQVNHAEEEAWPVQPLSARDQLEQQFSDDILQQKKARQWVHEVANDIAAIRYIDELADLYQSIGFVPLWQDTFTASDFEQQLRMVVLSNISSDFNRRYSLLQHYKQANDWRQYDLLATDTLFAYMSYVEGIPSYGKGWLFGAGVDPQLPMPSEATLSRLYNAIDTERLRFYINTLKPDDENYTRLLLAIDALEPSANDNWPGFYQPGIIRLGTRLKNPESLITVLEKLGDLRDFEADQIRAAGVRTYNVDLANAVKSFQRRHGLKVDGAIGPQTRQWLAISPKSRIRVLALNAQRTRLWPSDASSLLVVNIPNYELSLWLNDRHVLDSKVIVGRPSRRTPLMTTNVSSVVFNPYWNVPMSIMRKDILPKARRDRGYLHRNGFAVIRSWQSSEQIPIHTIDWRIVNAKSFPYRLRQKPGNRNALGRFKFNMPNDQAIYLHDTPAKSLFAKESRAFSSGCVRVEQAGNLAMILLNHSGVTEQRVNQLKARTKTKTVGLSNKVKIQVIYQTAWVDNDGLVNYRNDVYDYDKFIAMSQNQELFTSIYTE